MPDKIKLTKSAVDKLPHSEKGKQVDYYDTELPAFGVRVSATSKMYFVRKRINGKMTRVSLGRHGVITADKARNDAKDAFTDLRKGVDINKERAKSMERGITLGKVYEEYLTARPSMKERTKAVDWSLLNCHMSDWLKKPIRDITDDMVRRRHLKIGKESGANTANNSMRLFRRLYRYAGRSLKEALAPDLVKDALEGQWYKTRRRQTVVREHELSVWYRALLRVSNPIISDYLLLLLFTGLRENEGMKLRWDDVDMDDRSFVIRDPKNDNPHILLMSDFLVELFQRRLDFRENDFVFPGIGKSGHLVETKRQLDFIHLETRKILNGVTTDEEMNKLLEELPADKIKPGVRFCLHDLRRTFASVAEDEISYTVLKRLLNHSSKDVTQGYIVVSKEKLRMSMQRVTDAIKSFLLQGGTDIYGY